MALQDVRIPQMGEGLTEVVIVAFQKQPGDLIRRDEILYSMETDKATMEVESPFAGVLKEWLAKEGDILPIGAPIARIELEADAVAVPMASPSVASSGREAGAGSEVVIPPRTRAYAKQLGLADEELRRIPAPSGKLMPADVDAYLDTKIAGEPVIYTESAVTPQHRIFIHRLKRSAQMVIPAVIRRSLSWSDVARCAEGFRERSAAVQPSKFLTAAYCIVQAIQEHPRFRSSLIGEETIREYKHVNLGIAVAAGGQLTTAVVPDADTLSFADFVRAAQAQIGQAREGKDQATESTQLLLTYMGAYDVVDAIPVLVAPAVGVLFIGSVFVRDGEPTVNFVLTFDHRLVQGVEAAEFMHTVVEKIKQVEAICVA